MVPFNLEQTAVVSSGVSVLEDEITGLQTKTEKSSSMVMKAVCGIKYRWQKNSKTVSKELQEMSLLNLF